MDLPKTLFRSPEPEVGIGSSRSPSKTWAQRYLGHPSKMSLYSPFAMTLSPTSRGTDMFHVFIRSIDGKLVAKVALAPDDFCHVLFLEISFLLECDDEAFSLLVGTRPLQHDDMVAEQLTASLCDITLLWHKADLGTHDHDARDSPTQSSD
jgi:hypothetical protein